MKKSFVKITGTALALFLCMPVGGEIVSQAKLTDSCTDKFNCCTCQNNTGKTIGPVVPGQTVTPSTPIDVEPFYSYLKESCFLRPSVFIELPLYRQATNYTCGCACVASLLRYMNYDFDVREDNLAEILHADPDQGTHMQNISYYLNNIRYDTDPEGTSYFNTKIVQNMKIRDLEKELDAGNPVIMPLQAWNWNQETGEYELSLDYSNDWESGHYVIALGYDNKNILFMDPSTGANYTYIPKNELVARWHDVGGDGIVYNQAGVVVNMCKSCYTLKEFYKIL